jgi:hypothetical protein
VRPPTMPTPKRKKKKTATKRARPSLLPSSRPIARLLTFALAPVSVLKRDYYLKSA